MRSTLERGDIPGVSVLPETLTEREVQDIAVTIAALLAGRVDGQGAVATTVAQFERILASRARPASVDAETLVGRIAEALYLRVMDATADEWTEWQHLTDFKREPYLTEAQRIASCVTLAADREPDVFADDVPVPAECIHMPGCGCDREPDGLRAQVEVELNSEDAHAVLYGVTGTDPDSYGGVSKDEALECAGELLTRLRALLAHPATDQEGR